MRTTTDKDALKATTLAHLTTHLLEDIKHYSARAGKRDKCHGCLAFTRNLLITTRIISLPLSQAVRHDQSLGYCPYPLTRVD